MATEKASHVHPEPTASPAGHPATHQGSVTPMSRVEAARRHPVPRPKPQDAPAPQASRPATDLQLLLGNPSGATTSDEANYLIQRTQYSLSYSRTAGIANWVSWHLNLHDLGHVHRSNDFMPDMSLPPGWYEAEPTDFTRTGYNRGHMCPSEHRTDTIPDNMATFILTNVLPQAPGNDQGPWALFEAFLKDQALQGLDLFMIAGGDGSLGTLNDLGKIQIPENTWYITLISQTAITDPSQVTADVRAIALRMPNDNTISKNRWQDFRVSIAEVEAVTGYTFLSSVPAGIAGPLKSQVDAE